MPVHRVRLATGLVLLAFATVHLLNHAVGLISLAAMEAARPVLIGPWQTPVGLAMLYGALSVHAGLALWGLYRRRTWRMRPWEAAQLLLGLAIPFLLAEHVTATRGATQALEVAPSYAVVQLAFWWFEPEKAALQAITLLVVWLHGVMGLHYWLRVRPWYPLLAPGLAVLVVVIPTVSLSGFLASGLEIRALAATPGYVEAVFAEARLPPDAAVFVARGTGGIQAAMLTLILLAIAGRLALAAWRRRRSRPRLYYRDSRVLDLIPGATVLEMLRAADVPHASVCGGRGRCSTCRVRTGAGGDQLPPPAAAERKVLDRIGAGPDVRLACQIRPAASLEVTPLLPPTATVRDGFRRPGYLAGQEREIAILFADLRGFTRLSDGRLPYDVVFILNRYFAATGQAVTRSGGRLDKFIGDGVMALFGVDGGPEQGCRQALDAALAMQTGIAALSDSLRGDLREPLRIGIGIHVGPAIVGEMGWGDAKGLTAIGDAVNIASRLETLTKDHQAQLIVSEAVAERAGRDLGRFRREHVVLRGKLAPLPVRIVQDVTDLERER